MVRGKEGFMQHLNKILGFDQKEKQKNNKK